MIEELRDRIQGTLDNEEDNLKAYDPMLSDPEMYNCQGWVEALKYVMGQIEFLTADEVESD